MGNNNALVVTVTVNGIDINLLTRNGYGYVLTGTGAELVKPEHMTDVQKSAAINTKNYGETPLGLQLAEDVGIIAEELPINLQGEDFKRAKAEFNNAVEYLKNLSGEEFTNLVIYSEVNFNKFPDIEQLRGAVNADDAWCSAIINKARKINKEVEHAVFNVFTFDTDFVTTLRNKNNTSIEAKVAAYKAMFNDEYNKMAKTYDELNKLERTYREFMTDTDIKK